MHTFFIALSGVCEITFAILLLFKQSKKIGAWLIIAMLIVFFIIHIQMLIDYWQVGGIMFLVSVIRIPLQVVLIWWAYSFTKKPQPI